MTAVLLLAIRKKELARQEDQLLARISENRLIDALESIEEGVVLYDADDRFVFCNTKYKDNLSIIRHMFVPGTSFEDILRAATKANIVTGSADDPENISRIAWRGAATWNRRCCILSKPANGYCFRNTARPTAAP